MNVKELIELLSSNSFNSLSEEVLILTDNGQVFTVDGLEGASIEDDESIDNVLILTTEEY